MLNYGLIYCLARLAKHLFNHQVTLYESAGEFSVSSLLISDQQDVVIVSFKDVRILDEHSIQQIGQEFNDLTLQAASGRKLLMDFSHISFMSSAMIGQVMKLYKLCKRDGIKFKLCGISPSILEVFRLTGLHKILEIHPNRAEALAVFGPPSPGWSR